MRHHATVVSALACALGATAITSAGDLAPPAGPIQATDRITLNAQSATLPYTITQPGSYVFTSDLTGVAGQSGIIIQADDVSIDLNGFALRGVPGSIHGIDGLAAHDNVSVRNGTITAWGLHGAVILGSGHIFTDLRVFDNNGIGISAGTNCIAERCTASDHNGGGIFLRENAVIRACTSENNSGGIETTGPSVISDCTARNNALRGFSIGDGSTITNCSAHNNTNEGIHASEDCTVSNCTARGNQNDGIEAESGTTIQNCTSNANVGNGIRIGNNCTARNNSCDGNGVGAPIGAGIFCYGDMSRIDQNFTTDNDFGVQVTGTDCFITRNAASGNGTSFSIAGVSSFGPLVVVTGVASIVGTPNADHPWANYAH